MTFHPVALEIGSLSIRWYGICAALGMFLAYSLQYLRRKRYNISSNDISDLTFCCVVAGIVGARLAYVIRFWSQEFAGQGFWEPFMIHHGGLIFHGGFILAFCAAIILCRRRKWSFWQMADLMAPALPLGHACGRLGCLLNGCCFGFAFDGPLAVQYAPECTNVTFIQCAQELIQPGEKSLPTFPIEGIAALVDLLLCVTILLLERKGWLKGYRFLLYGMLYAVARFCTEFGRGDYILPPGQLTPAQTICIWVFLVAAAIFAARKFMSAPIKK